MLNSYILLIVLMLSAVNAQVFKKTILKNHRSRISRNSESLKNANANEILPKRVKEYEVSDQYKIDKDDGEMWYPIIDLIPLENQPENSKENAVESFENVIYEDNKVFQPSESTPRRKVQAIETVQNIQIEESNSQNHQEQVQSEKARELQRKLDSDNFAHKHNVVILPTIDTDSQSLKELEEISHQRIMNLQKVHQALHPGVSDQEFEQIERKEIENSQNTTEVEENEVLSESKSEEVNENGFQQPESENIPPVEEPLDNNGIIESNQQIQNLDQNFQSNGNNGVQESHKTIKKVKTFTEEIEEKEDIVEPGKKEKEKMVSNNNDLLNDKDKSEQRTKRVERVAI